MKLQKKESKIIIIKDKTKTERFPTKVGNLKKKEKTLQQQKGLPTLSADLNNRDFYVYQGISLYEYSIEISIFSYTVLFPPPPVLHNFL